MKTIGIVAAGISGLLIIVAMATGLFVMGTYNGLITRGEAVNNAWAQVENVYQRRMDLIPNLVETVKGAANFERGTLTAVTQARASVGQYTVDKSILDNPEAFAKFQQSQGVLGSALSRLMVVMEKYPDIKATQNFRDLQIQIEGTENRIAVERRTFNEVAMGYNTAIKRFPANIVAGFGGFKEKAYFKAEEGAAKAPKVSFDAK